MNHGQKEAWKKFIEGRITREQGCYPRPPGSSSGNSPAANPSPAGGGAPALARQRYFALLRSILATLLLSLTAVRGGVIVSPVGDPMFQIADLHLFAAPTGPFSEQTSEALFPAHFPTRVVHQPPYVQELTEGLALTGFPEGAVFDVSEFTFPSGVYLGFVLAPGPAAPNGSAFDFASGPIIPNSVFPVLVQGDVFLNGALFEGGAFALNIPPAVALDGYSHIVAAVFEDSSFAPPGLTDLTGAYEYRLTLRDSGNNGYNVVGEFSLVPEPGTWTLLGVGAVGLAGYAWRRRRCVGEA